MKHVFFTGIVYTVSKGVLFIPAGGFKQAISPGDKFLKAKPPSYVRKLNGHFFRMIDDPKDYTFSVLEKYAHLIVKYDES